MASAWGKGQAEVEEVVAAVTVGEEEEGRRRRKKDGKVRWMRKRRSDTQQQEPSYIKQSLQSKAMMSCQVSPVLYRLLNTTTPSYSYKLYTEIVSARSLLAPSDKVVTVVTRPVFAPS